MYKCIDVDCIQVVFYRCNCISISPVDDVNMHLVVLGFEIFVRLQLLLFNIQNIHKLLYPDNTGFPYRIQSIRNF